MTGDGSFALALAGLPRPIGFERGTGDVADGLRRVLRGWPIAGADAKEAIATVLADAHGLVVERHDTGWRLPQQTPVGAVCQVVVEAVDLLVHADARFGALHAAAIVLDGRLILLPAGRRAGKSTLVAALAADGAVAVADDLILFDTATAEAVATGCLPRLRLPLPESADAGLGAFVASSTVLSDGYYAYIDPGPECHAAHGARFEFGAIVIPEARMEPGPPTLDAISVEEALLGLLGQDTRRAGDARDLFAFHRELAETLPAFRLRYHAPQDGALCLAAAFETQSSNWQRHDARSAHGGLSSEAAMGVTDGPLQPAPDICLQEVGKQAFLVRPETGDIHHLDAIGRAVWILASAGHEETAIASLLASAFPDTPAERVAADVAAIVGEFVEAGLMDRR